MKTKLKLIAFALLGILNFSALLAPMTFAANNNNNATNDQCANTLPEEVLQANGCPGHTTNGTLENTITNILNAVIGVSGLVAVVFVVIGGINYMTAAGDAGKVKKAKDTILYACIGIAVCALSFAIVNWVVLTALK